MRTRFFASLAAGVVLSVSLPGYAQDVKTILNKVTATYQNVKSYQAQATLVETRLLRGQQQKRTSTITTKYKAPNKMVTIVQGSQSLQVYSDGKTMYIYSPEKKEYMKMPAPVSLAQTGGGLGSGDPAQIGMQLQAMFGQGAKKLADQRVGGKPAFVLQSSRSGQSQDGTGSFKMTATAFIDKATYVLRQITIDASQGQGAEKAAQTIVLTFASQQINPNLPDSVFAFKPPAGAKEQQMPTPQSGRMGP